MVRYEFNEENNGIEIYFDSIPSDETRATLRENGWRWYKAKKCWYTRCSDASIAIAQKICGETRTFHPCFGEGLLDNIQSAEDGLVDKYLYINFKSFLLV